MARLVFFKPQLEFISMNGDFSNATNVYLSKLGSILPAFCFCCPSELFESYFKHCLEFGMCNSKLKLSLISFIGQRWAYLFIYEWNFFFSRTDVGLTSTDLRLFRIISTAIKYKRLECHKRCVWLLLLAVVVS